MGTFPETPQTLRDGAVVVLRSAVEADAGAFMDFRRHTASTSPYVATLPEELTDTPEDATRTLAQFRDRSTELLLLALAPGQGIVAGVGLRSPGKIKLNHTVDLGMSIHADWRSRGLGSVILNAALDWAARHPDILKVCLGVIPDNAPAMRLYQRCGFVVEGVQKRHVRQPPGLGTGVGREGGFLDHVLMAKWVK